MDSVEPHLCVVLISTFASAVRTAEFSGSSYSRLAKSTVEEAMGQVAACFRANRRCDPRHDQYGAVDPLITLQLKGYGNDDPLERRQRALPPFFFRVTYEKSSSRLETAISETIIVAYFFAMRSCEFSPYMVKGKP